jgi:tricorn protease
MYSWNRPVLWATFILALAMIAGTSFASDMQGYYRWPTVFGDRVVFTAEGDLWDAPLAGGVARRLTTAPGQEVFAMFSPDGKWIAFSGNYDGGLDVYVMPAEGGAPKRLTYDPAGSYVAGWTPDGKVIFRTMAYSGQYIWKVFTISPQGGYPEPVPVDEAAHITYEPNGDRIAYTRVSLGFRTWKRYRGGWAEQIMVGSTKSHDYKQVTTWVGNNSVPMWYKGRIYFLRDRDWDSTETIKTMQPNTSATRVNLYSMNPDGSDLQQLTAHDDWDVRWPNLTDGKIAYSVGADIWVYDIDKNQESKVAIQLPSDLTQARNKFVQPDEYTNEFSLSPDGKRLLVGARGDLFTFPTERRGVIKQITMNPGAREKGASFLPNGERILAWSDITGEEALYSYPAKKPGEPKKIADGKGGWNFPVEISPDGKMAVYGDNNRKLQLVNIESGSTTQIDTSGWEIRNYSWSPDSRYIAYSVSLPSQFEGIRIYDTKEHEVHSVTDDLYSSYSPTWDPKGKWLYFVSDRYMNPFSSANDWSFIVLETNRIYGLALDPATKDPYAYTEDGTAIGDEKSDSTDNKDKDKKDEKKDKKAKDKDKDKDKEKEEKVTVNIVWDGLMNRLVELPIAPGNYGGLSAIEGKLYFISVPTTGWRSRDVHDEDELQMTLKLFDIKKKKESDVVEGVRGYTLSHDLKKIAVRKKSGFVIMDAGDTEEPKANKDDKDVGLHLEDWVYDVDPRAEWKQIFGEAWRLQRDFFYDPEMHNVNWKYQHDHYATLLDRIQTRAELNDLIAQMISELDAGHAYIGGGDLQHTKNIGVGLLGVNVTKDKSGFYRIDRILHGDPWDDSRSSPLARAGMNVKEGEYIVAIDNQPTSSVDNYLQLLDNRAGKPVIVSINSKPSLDGAHDIVVKTLDSEGELRYWDWVYGRMEYVRKHGGEDIGYVHLSDMGAPGMEEWMKEYYPQAQKKALIMDVRYNGGGNIAEWILSELQRNVWTWGAARNGQHYHRPGSAFYGPMIALCNEETGSDGETFSEGWKRLKLGPLVGKRTWGGWVGIRGDKPFIDRGFFSEPEFTGWALGPNGKSKWLIEGPGVSPDVVMDNHPAKMMDGVDEQLDYAIQYLKDQMKNHPMPDPPMPKYPNHAPEYPTWK